MAYRTKRSYRRKTYRRRTYRRKSYRRPTRPSRRPLSRKRILNITSVKKHDNMAPTVMNNPTTGANTAGGIQMTQSTGIKQYLFCPTARSIDFDGVRKDEISARTKTNTYARGYAERNRFNIGGATGWLWRRICFTMKGTDATALFTTPAGQVPGSNTNYAYTSNGYMRNIYEFTADPGRLNFQSYVFAGSVNVDWNDIMTAKVDNSRVTVKSDTTTMLAPDTNGGKLMQKNRWYPMNKSLVYTDDEAGTDQSSLPYSTLGRAGMGDYFIYDLFQPAAGGLSTDALFWQPEGIYYWHER